MEDTLALLTENEDDRSFAEHVAKRADLKFWEAPNISELVEAIDQEKVAVSFVDATLHPEVEAEVGEKIGLYSEKLNPNRFHFLSSSDLGDANAIMNSPLFGNYVQRNFKDAEGAGDRYGYVVRATLMEKAFGLKNFLPEKSKIQTIRFKKTSQKQEGVEAVKNFLIAVKFKSRMATVVANAVDELVMNGMFDAPADEFGNPLYMSTPRDTEMELDGQRMVEMHVGYDGRYVAISCVDQYGSLDKKKLVSHISKRYTEEEYKVRRAMAGAGIGLATVFRSGGSFLFSSDKGDRTEVTVFFKRTDNFRDFKEQFRFIATQFYL